MLSSNMYLELGISDRELCPSQPVGFDHLPNQLVDHKIKKGFSFNIICIGETGCGKSSFLDTLFDKQLHLSSESEVIGENISLKHHTFVTHEGPVNLSMRISESSGYGDFIDKTDCCKYFTDYVESQLQEYFIKKQMVHRNLKKIHDNRVHLCFYMIPSSCARLKLVDVMTMKALSQYVHIIPLISKCDALTKEELANFKLIVREQLQTNNIQIYRFPTIDTAIAEKNSKMNDIVPFGVVSGNSIETINGKSTRVRKLPWGMVKIDDENHCDITYLRDMIFRVNLDDIIHKTSQLFYSSYRSKFLKNGNINDLRVSLYKERLKKYDISYVGNRVDQEEQLRASFDDKFADLQSKCEERTAKIIDEFRLKSEELCNKRQELLTAADTTPLEHKKSKKKH